MTVARVGLHGARGRSLWGSSPDSPTPGALPPFFYPEVTAWGDADETACEAGCCSGWRAPLSITAGPTLWLRGPRARPSSAGHEDRNPAVLLGPSARGRHAMVLLRGGGWGSPRCCCVGWGRRGLRLFSLNHRGSQGLGVASLGEGAPPASLQPDRHQLRGKSQHSDLHRVREAVC